MINTIRNIFIFRKILWVQVVSGVKLQVVDTRLGFLWIILEPLILMCMYYFLRVIVFHSDSGNFFLFILPTLLCWQWFSRGLTAGLTAIQSSSSLLRKRMTPLIITIIPPILSYSLYPIIGLLVIYSFAHEMKLINFIMLIPILFIQLILTIGLATILATFNVFIPDIKKSISFIIRGWWFLSPVLYSADRVLESPYTSSLTKKIYALNPFVFIMSAYRDLFNGGSFQFNDSLYWLIVSIFIFFISIWFINIYENDIKKML